MLFVPAEAVILGQTLLVLLEVLFVDLDFTAVLLDIYLVALRVIGGEPDIHFGEVFLMDLFHGVESV